MTLVQIKKSTTRLCTTCKKGFIPPTGSLECTVCKGCYIIQGLKVERLFIKGDEIESIKNAKHIIAQKFEELESEAWNNDRSREALLLLEGAHGYLGFLLES